MTEYDLPPPPPGFVPFSADAELVRTRRVLPHWHAAHVTQFVTFRLTDSLPQEKLREIADLRRRLLADGGGTEEARTEADREVFRRYDRYLDAGLGACWLRDGRLAEVVASAIRHFDGDRYNVGAFVVMPNHVHALIRPIDRSLSRILESIKGFSARRINEAVGRTGRVWQPESFDRIVRDVVALWRAVQYIGANPRRAGIDVLRWVSPAWVDCGWGFRDVD